MVPWSGPAGEKRSLGVDDGEQLKKQCTGERNEQRLSLPPPLLDDDDEILWSELVEHDCEILEEWEDELDCHKELPTKENEKGSNVHEKSLIWAAKDTEWKKLKEKGASC